MTAETIARLRIRLEDIEPEVWRVIEVPVTAHLQAVHDAIQAAMGWENYHLFEFEVGEQRYGIPDPDGMIEGVKAARNVKLAALIARGVREMSYTYDYGDDWRHRVTIEAVEPGAENEAYPRLVDGARRCPPEDVGGPPGYEYFLEAISDPAHEEHADLLRWCGGAYDPADMNKRALKWRIDRLAVRRIAGKAAYEKGKSRR